jgi:DNA polymerase III alpha subunit
MLKDKGKLDIKEFNEDDVEGQIKNFDNLLDQIDNLNDKKKQLWSQIYQNALSDRHNAFVMFRKLFDVVKDDENKMKSTEMAVHGKTIQGFLERMAKTTEQLLKLADLIAAAESKSTGDDPLSSPERIYDQIQKSKR